MKMYIILYTLNRYKYVNKKTVIGDVRTCIYLLNCPIVNEKRNINILITTGNTLIFSYIVDSYKYQVKVNICLRFFPAQFNLVVSGQIQDWVNSK